MTRLQIPGGSYAAALVGGAYVVQVGDHLQTHEGTLPNPGTDLLFLVATNVGGFKFAGKQHEGVNALEWDGAWQNVGPAPGNRPVCYDRSGNLHIASVDEHGPTGSIGWRYCDLNGQLVASKDTYADPVRQVYEYTTLGDVTIGQSGLGGAVAVFAGSRYLLESGDTQFINVDRMGDDFAIAIVKLLEHKTVLLWCSKTELTQFPQQPLVTTPPPIVVPPPVEPPKSMPTAPNQLATVKRVYAAHPEINGMRDVERGQLTTLVVQALGGFPWGRKAKNKEKTVFSDDALCYRLQDNRFEIYDTQVGFPQPGDPGYDPNRRVANVDIATWNYAGTFADGENGWFATVAGPPDPPSPPDPPQPATDPAILARLDALDKAVDFWVKAASATEERLTRINGTLNDALEAAARRIEALEQKPSPRYQAMGTTSRDWGHSHRINVTLEPLP